MMAWFRFGVGRSVLLLVAFAMSGCGPGAGEEDTGTVLRVMTFNIEDLRTTDLLRPDHPRVVAAARIIQKIRPDILLVNEFTYDMEGVPGFVAEQGPGSNARRFVTDFLAVSQGPGLEPLHYEVYAPPTNTGVASGFDLDNDGVAVTDYPAPESSAEDGLPPRQTPAQRAYGNDSWGFGTFPGQYGMALFVAPELEIIRDSIRTFRHFLWRDMPDALRPMDADSTNPWYDYLEWSEMRLSSKNHIDVPVRLPGGQILHVLASHPTPPAFDGPEGRNRLRNHDEIRFWVDYVNGAAYFVDDVGEPGGLPEDATLVIMGDLNADPDEGSAHGNPVMMLLTSDAVNGSFTPRASQEGVEAFPELDPDDTAEWGLRVDYVLPSGNIEVVDGGVYRSASPGERASDHFPVWVDVRITG